jgi:hypothetical protein
MKYIAGYSYVTHDSATRYSSWNGNTIAVTVTHRTYIAVYNIDKEKYTYTRIDNQFCVLLLI